MADTFFRHVSHRLNEAHMPFRFYALIAMVFRSLSGKNWLAQYSKLIGAWTKRSRIPQDTEDALQDAALAMLEAGDGAIRDPDRYFQRAASNRAISIHRAEVRRETQSLEDLAEAQHPLSPGADAICHARELIRLTLAALEELPESCRIAFALRQTEGLSNGEIGKRMGVSRNMVERYMMRTTRHLQDRLQDHLDFPLRR